MVFKASVSRAFTFLSTGAILAIRSCAVIGSVEEVSTNVSAIVLNVFLKLIKYVSMALIIVLLALGIFLISSIFSKSPDVKPEKTENPQKPDNRSERRHHGSSSDQNTSSQQSPDQPIETTVPSKPNSNSQSGGSAGSVSPSVPDKVHNALSSHANQSEVNSNGGTNGHTHSSDGNSQNDNSTTINLNQAAQHGEEVVSSDQQNAIDAANNSKK